ncbi:PAS domain-containing protein [Fibrella sp. WM1]
MDWSQTTLGTPDTWPQSLRATLSILLNSTFPMFLWWGKDLIQFYNDAYRPSLGYDGKHPTALGQAGEACWPEIWPTIKPLIDQVMAGGDAVWRQNELVSIYRNGRLEDVYWTFSYSPIYDETDRVAGVLVTCEETTQQVLASRRLNLSEGRFQRLVEQAPVAVALLSGPQFVITLANERVLDYWGRDRSQVMDKPLFDALPEARGQGFEALLSGVYTTGERFVAKELTVMMKRHGVLTPTYVDFVYEPFYEDDGRICGVLMICTEITEQVQSRQKVEASEARFRSLIEETPVATALFRSKDLIIELANEVMIRYWQKGSEVVGKPYREAVPELAGQGYFEKLEEVFDTGVEYHATGGRADILENGVLQTHYYNYSFTPLFDATGAVYAVLNMGNDVTESVLAQQRINEHQNRLLASFADMPVGLAIIAGEALVFTMVNAFYAMLTGRSTEALLNKPLLETMPELTGQGFDERLKEVMATGKPFMGKEAPVEIRRNGQLETIYVDYTYQPQRDEAGTVSGVLVVVIDVTQQVLTRRGVEESRRHLLAMFDEAPVAIATVTAADELVFQSANTFYSELVGRQPDQLIGAPMLTALPELVGKGFDDLLQRVIQTGSPFMAQEVAVELVRHSQLETRYVNFTYQPIRDTNGQTMSVLIVATDVTQQVLARQQVEASEDKLRSLIAAAPAGIGLFVGRDLIIEHPNQTFIDIVGKGPGVAGLPLREAMPELLTEGQPFLQILDDVYTSGVPFISPASLVKIRQNGVLNDNYYNISYTPVRNTAGEVYAILDIAIDVTAQVKAQQALAESEAHLQLLRDTVPAMIFYLDAEQRYQSYNKVFMEWFGVDAEGALGQTVRAFLGEAAYQKSLPYLTRAYAGQQVRYEMHAPTRMPGGRWLSIVYTPHKTPEGAVIGVIVHATDITLNKQSEIDLRESEARFRSLVENTPDVITRWDDQLRLAFANEAFAQKIGEPLTALLGKKHDEMGQPASVAQSYMDVLQKVLDTQVLQEYYNSSPEPDGRVVAYHSRLVPELDEAGRVESVLSIARDITDIKRNEDQINAIYNNAPAAIGLLEGREMVIRRPNQTFIHMMGKGAGIEGKPLKEALPEFVQGKQAGKPFLTLLDEVYASGRPYHTDETQLMLFRDGVMTNDYYDLAYIPLLNAEGRTYAIVVFALLVTEQVQARQQLEEKEKALRNAVELAELGTWTMEIETRTIRFSRKHADMLGLDADEMPYADVLAIIHPDDHLRVRDAFIDAVKPGADGKYETEYRAIHAKTGRQRIIHSLGETYFEDGRPVRVAGTAQDVTLERELQLALEQQVQQRTEELAAVNKALEASNREYAGLNIELEEANGLLLRSNDNLQQFAYVASHDLQEPLRKIKQFGTLLKEQYAPALDEGANDIILRMASASDRMAILIQDLLAYSRLTAQPAAREPVDLNQVVGRALLDLELVVDETGATIHVAPLPTVSGYPSQLEQLVLNLISNALKFRRPEVPPLIEIRSALIDDSNVPSHVKPASQARQYHQIDVIDNGVGFDEKYLARIFQVFQRLHSKSQFVGTGIGLAICEKVAVNHGGAITAKSQPEQGATFSVYLPANEPNPAG